MKPLSRTLARKEARALGLRHYRTGQPCARGHVALRLVSDACCIVCKRLANAKRDAERRALRAVDTTPNLLLPRWTAERDAELKRLLETNSFSKAAALMGITKNQAIGRAYRMGMMSPKTKRTSLVERLDKLNIFPSHGKCLFPHGHPREPGFHFCGERVLGVESSDCPHHALRVIVPEKRAA